MIFTRHAGMKLINKRIHSYAHAHSMHIHADQIPRKRCGKENRPTKNIQTILKKKTMETRIIQNISNKMKEDVGMSKPKKHVNKVGRLT